MHNYGIKERESPVYCQAQEHKVYKKGHDDVPEKNRVFFNEFSGPKRVEETLGKIGQGIIFQIEAHGSYFFFTGVTSSLVGILSVHGTQLWQRPQAYVSNPYFFLM